MAAPHLEILDLGCTRGDRPLFTGLREHVAGGELLHVAGSNGSGKTTLLRTLCGLSRPAAGEIRWRGTPVRALGDQYRAEIAYVGHKDGVQGELSAAENLEALSCGAGASATEMRRQIDAALERLGLAAYAPYPAKLLSQGQRRRLALARLLVQSKPLWVLDEPFTALDAASCRLVAALVSEHLAAGGIAVLSSHQAFDIAAATVKRVDLDRLSARAFAWAGGPEPRPERASHPA
ncbi:MAG TPA: cytochrome c biogenesis heme-transporting ATPase CcmA [Burkholderiales bacterium]